jgi:hypothetical protein
LLTLNGFYLSDAFRASRALFWLLDALQFVVVPAVSLRRGDRFRGLPAISCRRASTRRCRPPRSL